MKIEVRSGGVHIEGYVNAVERDSKIINVPSIGRCVEQIRAGAFENALNTAPDVAILENHDFSRQLGSVSQGNLKLYEDNIGLRAIADITDTDIAEKARHGQIKGWSFGFICNEQEIEQRSGNVPRRIVKALSLAEVSLIDGNYTPCYNGTLVEVRSEGNFVEYRSGIDEKVEYKSSSDSENLIYTQLSETDSTAADENIENRSGEEIDYSYYENMLRYLELSGGGYSHGKSGRYEKRYNHNHDDKGRFCSGSGSGNSNSVLTNEGKSFIIKAGLSNNPLTDKPLDYFSSDEYKDKFKELGENPFVTESMYECARAAIKNNYYADGEDAYTISTFLGKYGNPTHADGLEVKCELPKNAKDGQYIIVHNHPNNTPLSLEDVVAASDKKGIKRMIAASHDGKIYYLEIGNGKRLSDFGITQDAQEHSTPEWRDFEFRKWGGYCKDAKGNLFEALKSMNEKENYGWKVGVIE